jgi:hypothetical protein
MKIVGGIHDVLNDGRQLNGFALNLPHRLANLACAGATLCRT